MASHVEPTGDIIPNNNLLVARADCETGAQAVARTLLNPEYRNALSASGFASKALGGSIQGPGIMDFVDHLDSATRKAEAGDLSMASRILASQAITLDSMFTELARQASNNMGEYIHATERFGRLALKAQSHCRATLDSLAKLHQPREQTVRHVHVNEGGQAVIADQFHHHTGVHRNAESVEQPHAAGTDAAGSGPAMLGHDAQWDGMPIPGDKGGETMPNARRQRQRRA